MADVLKIDRTRWLSYVGQVEEYSDSAFRKQALVEGRILMRCAREIIDKIIDRLTSRGYVFAYPDRYFVPPEDDALDLIDDLQDRGLCLPVSFQAWMIEVGVVNLMGTDKSWDFTGYANSEQDVWFTDPLVVECESSYIAYLYDEWKYRCAEDGREETGPYRIDFAPDHLHKANISGGLPYQLAADQPVVDTLVLNDEVDRTFVQHIQRAISWSGFPGFELINNRPTDFLDQMVVNLDQIA